MLPVSESWERVERALEGLTLAMKYYGTEMTNVISVHNTLAGISHLALITIGEARKCQPIMSHTGNKNRYW